MRRRLFGLVAGLLLALAAAAQSPSSLSQRNLEDFDALWKAIDSGYADIAEKRDAWKRARAAWRPKAAAAKTRADLVLVLEGALAYLRDDAVSLSERAPSSARRVPGETGIWAEWSNGLARVTAVRAFSDADVGNLLPGHAVTHVNGHPIERVVREWLRGTGPANPAAMDWALRHVLAGPREGLLKLSVRGANEAKTITIEHRSAAPASGPPLLARRMGEDRDLAYIRIRNALGDSTLPAALDAALNYLKDTKALMLDLRETMDGGTREVTEAMLGKLTGAQAPYRAPIVVLVDRWTAGEGETLAAALQERARAMLVGTPTAGLRGELREVALPRSGIVAKFPAEKTARAPLQPSMLVDLAAPSGGPGDPILYQALKLASPARADRTGQR
jgi:carboxyl-terminal processing protease